MTKRFNRREFTKQSAWLAGAAAIVPAHVLGGPQHGPQREG